MRWCSKPYRGKPRTGRQANRSYGLANCQECGEEFTRKSYHSSRCPKCQHVRNHKEYVRSLYSYVAYCELQAIADIICSEHTPVVGCTAGNFLDVTEEKVDLNKIVSGAIGIDQDFHSGEDLPANYYWSKEEMG